MFFMYYAEPFSQYLWDFGLEVQSRALKVTCLAPVTSAVNHYLSLSDIIHILFGLLEMMHMNLTTSMHTSLVIYDSNNIFEVYLQTTDHDNLFHKITMMQNMRKTQDRRAGCSSAPLYRDMSPLSVPQTRK